LSLKKGFFANSKLPEVQYAILIPQNPAGESGNILEDNPGNHFLSFPELSGFFPNHN
jgi:hypothetical protein